MKKSTALLAVSAATSLMGMLPAEHAQAASAACTQGSNTAPVTCSIGTGTTSYVAQAVNFTGSNGVQMTYENTAAGFGACAAHLGGSQAYGLSTQGGSMKVVTGSSDINTAQTANSGSGC